MSDFEWRNYNKGAFNQSQTRFNFYCCPSGCKLLPLKQFCKENYLTTRQVERLARQGKIYASRYKNQIFVAWNKAYKPE